MGRQVQKVGSMTQTRYGCPGQGRGSITGQGPLDPKVKNKESLGTDGGNRLKASVAMLQAGHMGECSTEAVHRKSVWVNRWAWGGAGKGWEAAPRNPVCLSPTLCLILLPAST